MPFTVDERYHAAVIAIEGKFLGSVEGAAFKEALADLKEAGMTNVVVDLSKTDFMDSSGVGVLIGGHTTLRRAGGEIRLAGMEKRIRNLFMMTKLLGPVFDDYDTVDEAIESFREDPPAEASEAEGAEEA